jgi:hypothetical protein
MGSLYSVGYSGSAGGTGYAGFSGSSGPVVRSLSSHRLTLESNVAVSSTNQEAKTTLYLTPYIGNQISLYYNSVWSTYITDQISISLSGKTAGKNHDVFAYYNGWAVALELVEWTNDATRAIALATQDGVYVNSSDAKQKYMGTIRTTGTTGQCEDSFTSRYVWNMYNRFQRGGWTTNTASGWTYTGAAWREWGGGGVNQLRFKFVLGMPQTVFVQINANSVGAGYVGYGIDISSGGYTSVYVVSGSYVYYGPSLGSTNTNLLASGYHFITGMEYASGSLTVYSSSGTTTYAGSGPTVLLWS